MVIMKAITVQGGKTCTRTWSYGATGPVARTRARVPKSQVQVHVSRDYIFFLHLSGSNLGPPVKLWESPVLWLVACVTR